MSKIEVPQELKKQIVDLYVNKQLTRKDIKAKLNLSFGDSVIRRILEEENVEIRSNPGAKAGGRKKQEISRELQDQIIQEYLNGNGTKAIVKKLNLPFSFDKVRTILQDNNIHIRNSKEANVITQKKTDYRKYTINDDYCFESHDGAWLLGFIAADGYLPDSKGARNRVTISLARQDEEILYMIAKELEYNGNISQYESNGYPSSSLSFASKKIRSQIESYGIGNNKTFKLHHLPQLPEEYMIDFIRGFFDGDGGLYEPKDHKIRTNFTSASGVYLQEIVDFLEKKYDIPAVKVNSYERIHTIYNISYSVNSSFKLCDLFYLNNYLALPRKKQYYLQIKEKYSH